MQQSATPFRPPSLVLATVGLCLGTFMQVLDMTIATVSLPTIAGNLGASVNQSTWVITSFTVCQAISVPMTGFLTRIFGETKVFVWCTVLFTICSFLCGAATSLPALVAFRALQGAVSGPMYPVTQSLLISIYPPLKRGFAMAMISTITVVAPIVGPVLGGWITDSYSWRWIFYINVPLGIFASLVVAFQLAGRVEQLVRTRIDWIGIFTLVVGVGALQIMLDQGNDKDWFGSGLIVALAITAAIMLAIWLIWELTDPAPLVQLRLFRYRNFSSGTLVLTLGFSMFFAVTLLLPLWMQNTLGYTAIWSGLAVAPLGVVPVLTAYLIGKNAHRIDLRILAALSFVFLGSACLRFAGFNTDVNFAAIALTMLLFSCGAALFFMPMLTILLSELQGQEISEGSGSMTFIRTVGASFAASIVTYLWSRGGTVAHAALAEHVTPYNPAVQASLGASGQPLQQYLAEINAVITQQAMQVSFNQIMSGLGFAFFLLVVFVWFSRPPFIRGARGH